jgi:hypothetical protein
MKSSNQRYLTENIIQPIKCKVVVMFFLMLFIPAQQALAVSCHCFKERSFKPAQPASADPYILATARNSLLAAASGIDKGAVVRERMTGATETDLWLSSYLSTLVDISPDELLNGKDRASSWAVAFDAMDLNTDKLGGLFNEARKADEAAGMARALADPVLGRSFNIQEPTLARLRDAGANIAESALSLYLGGQLNRTAESIFGEVTSGKKTWGALFYSLGIRIDTVGDLIGEAVQKHMK